MISIRKKNVRTMQRQVVLEVLEESKTHPTAAEIYELARKKMEGISLSTVYRNLEKLVVQGRVLKLDLGSGPARYDATNRDHCHIQCTECGRVDDVMVHAKVALEEDIESSLGWRDVIHRVEFFGICPECQEK